MISQSITVLLFYVKNLLTSYWLGFQFVTILFYIYHFWVEEIWHHASLHRQQGKCHLLVNCIRSWSHLWTRDPTISEVPSATLLWLIVWTLGHDPSIKKRIDFNSMISHIGRNSDVSMQWFSGSRVNANYERSTSWAGCQHQTRINLLVLVTLLWL